MARQITIGALSSDTHAAEELALPVLSGMTALPIIRDALDFAVTQRRGVAVVGAKGMGKSLAEEIVINEFHEAERQKEDADASYEPCRIVSLLAPRTSSHRDVIVDIHGAIIEATPPTRVYGRPKTLGELRQSLVASARDERVAAVVLNESERLSDEGLTAIRDILADSEHAHKPRRSASYVRPGGLGVLLIGTPEFRARIERSSEAGQRWATCASIPPLTPAEVPHIYLNFFPAFRYAEQEVGALAWHQDVIKIVLRDRPTVTLRLIENHAREYFRLLVRNEGATYERLNAPFNRDLFVYAASRVNWVLPGETDQRAA